MKIDKITILGAGSWGTALAGLWGKDGRSVSLWGHDPDRAAQIQRTRVNSPYLPGLKLPDSVRVTSSLNDCADADLVVFVMPSTALREIATQWQRVTANPQAIFLSCTKGIEHGTGMRMSQVLEEVFPGHKV